MTAFNPISVTVASTRGGMFHHVGFDLLREDWPEIRERLRSKNPSLEFREEESPRDTSLDKKWQWVWVVMKDRTPVAVLLELAKIVNESYEIKFRPNEYP